MRRCVFACARHRPKLVFCSVVALLKGAKLSPVEQIERLPPEVQALLFPMRLMLRASEKFSLKPGQLRSLGLYLVSLPNPVVGCAPKKERAGGSCPHWDRTCLP